MAEPRQAVADRQNLVDLLLILGDDDAGLAMIEHRGDLVGDRVGVDRHRNCADHLRRGDRPVEPRPVRADDRHRVAPVETRARGDRRRWRASRRRPRPRSRSARGRNPCDERRGGRPAPRHAPARAWRTCRSRARPRPPISFLPRWRRSHSACARSPIAQRFSSLVGTIQQPHREDNSLPSPENASKVHACRPAGRAAKQMRRVGVEERPFMAQPGPCFWRIALVRRKVGEGRIAASGARSGC